MKVLLVVLMSFTMVVPDGLVKAEEQYLSTDKDLYFVGEPIMVTLSNYTAPDNGYYWIGIYKKGEVPKDSKSSFWVDSDPANGGLTQGTPINIL